VRTVPTSRGTSKRARKGKEGPGKTKTIYFPDKKKKAKTLQCLSSIIKRDKSRKGDVGQGERGKRNGL